MGAKGSLKDRIRFWKWNLKRRKKLKEQEQSQNLETKEQPKIYINPNPKKYNRIQVFFHTIFGLFFALFEPKQKPQTAKTILEEITQIQTEVTNIEDINHLEQYQQLLEQKKNGIQEMIAKNPQISKDAITKSLETLKTTEELIQQKLKQEEKTTISTPKKETEFVESNKEESVKEVIQPVVVTTNLEAEPIFTQEESQSLETSISKIGNVSQNEDLEETIKKVEEQDPYQKYLIDANKKLKKQSEHLKKIKEDIKKATTPQELYQLESDLLWIQSQLFLMEKEYQEISRTKEFQSLKNKLEYYKLDKNDLLKNSESIQNLIANCKQELEYVDHMVKQETVKLAKKPKEEKKKEPKKEEKPKQQFYLDVEDFSNMRAQILGDLNRQTEEIKDITFASATPNQGFFARVRGFIRNTAFLMMPTIFFKNKLAAALTSSILVHNRIRSLNGWVSSQPVLYETGEQLLTRIQNKQDCLREISFHLNSSLSELEQLKQIFLVKYQALFPNEIETMLFELNTLESQIVQKTIELQVSQQRLGKMKQKVSKY